MEHIVQFAIGIDDEAIKKNLEESAVKQITKNIQADVEKAMFNSRYSYGYGQSSEVDKDSPKEWVVDMVKDVIEVNKDQIIECAITELTKNMMRSKTVREAVKGAVENGTE